MDETRAFSVLVMVMMMMISLVVFVDSAGVVAPRALSPAREAEALVAVKSMLHDTANVLTDWKIAAGGGRPCGWGLVICNGDGHVSGLDLRNRSLSGTLSPEIGKLRQLRYLFLQHNAVSGPIPDTISTLKMLQRLDLSYNHFTGHIPGRLGQARDILFV
uniref:Leucine-rich repeat-containing N-terminal plant-type domain-containing protein n=1 Tax=Leersia perrieri TaxID=77586 RepID=A0A0D9XRD7_9ORYZ